MAVMVSIEVLCKASGMTHQGVVAVLNGIGDGREYRRCAGTRKASMTVAATEEAARKFLGWVEGYRERYVRGNTETVFGTQVLVKFVAGGPVELARLKEHLSEKGVTRKGIKKLFKELGVPRWARSASWPPVWMVEMPGEVKIG